jgi:DNA polymerase/3'-5' exonuclease PolX
VTFPARIALAAAEWLVNELRPATSQIAIAGSLRRGKLEVKDIEIVAEPVFDQDLFGGQGFDRLNEVLLFLSRSHKLYWRGRQGGLSSVPPDLDGRKYYACAVAQHSSAGREALPIPVDLFAVRAPAQWGPILAIRTGPAEFSKRLVTTALKRGYKCLDGRLEWKNPDGEIVVLQTPSEREFIDKCGVRWAEPHERV